jgi:hypothetical protein
MVAGSTVVAAISMPMALHMAMTAKMLNAVPTTATAMPMSTRLRRQNHGEGQ